MTFNLLQHTHLLVIAGSRAYGIHIPGKSDVDLKGIAIPPKEYLLGIRSWENTDAISEMAHFAPLLTEEEQSVSQKTKLEGVVYDLRKAAHLIAACNPNMLDLLFGREDEVRICSPILRKLRDQRHLFVSAKAYHTMLGYAKSELGRIKMHHAWMVNPPSAPPTREQFGLPEIPVIPGNQMTAILSEIQRNVKAWVIDYGDMPPSEVDRVQDLMEQYLLDRSLPSQWTTAAQKLMLHDNMIQTLQDEQRWQNAVRSYKQYEGWVKNRNPERYALEKQVGYDAKNAGHLVRIFRMGMEILTTGQVHIWRGPSDHGPNDAEEIRDIRQGAWTYEQVMTWAQSHEEEMANIYKTKTYVCPEQADKKAIEDLLMEAISNSL